MNISDLNVEGPEDIQHFQIKWLPELAKKTTERELVVSHDWFYNLDARFHTQAWDWKFRVSNLCQRLCWSMDGDLRLPATAQEWAEAPFEVFRAGEIRILSRRMLPQPAPSIPFCP